MPHTEGPWFQPVTFDELRELDLELSPTPSPRPRTPSSGYDPDIMDLMTHSKVLEKLLARAQEEIEKRVGQEAGLRRELAAKAEELSELSAASEYVEVLTFDHWEAAERRWRALQRKKEAQELKAAQAWIAELLSADTDRCLLPEPGSDSAEVALLRARLTASEQALRTLQQASLTAKPQSQPQPKEGEEGPQARCDELEKEIAEARQEALIQAEANRALQGELQKRMGLEGRVAELTSQLEAQEEGERGLREELEQQKVKALVLETSLAALTFERDHLKDCATRAPCCLKAELLGKKGSEEVHKRRAPSEDSQDNALSSADSEDGGAEVPLEQRVLAQCLLRNPAEETYQRCGCYLMAAVVAEYQAALQPEMLRQMGARLERAAAEAVLAISGRPKYSLLGIWPKGAAEVKGALERQEAATAEAITSLAALQSRLQVLQQNLLVQTVVSQRLAHEKASLITEVATTRQQHEETRGAVEELLGKLQRAMAVIGRLHAEKDSMRGQGLGTSFGPPPPRGL